MVDKEGRADRRECPWLDGTLQGPEALFALIRYYLSRLGVGQADTLVVIADGARWIWKRVAELVTHCGLRKEQVYEVVDFYPWWNTWGWWPTRGRTGPRVVVASGLRPNASGY